VTDDAFVRIVATSVIATLVELVCAVTVAERVFGWRRLVFGRNGVGVDHGRVRRRSALGMAALGVAPTPDASAYPIDVNVAYGAVVRDVVKAVATTSRPVSGVDTVAVTVAERVLGRRRQDALGVTARGVIITLCICATIVDVRVTDDAFARVVVKADNAALIEHVGAVTVAERMLGRWWIALGVAARGLVTWGYICAMMADVRVTDDAFARVGVANVATLVGLVCADAVAKRVLGRRQSALGVAARGVIT